MKFFSSDGWAWVNDIAVAGGVLSFSSASLIRNPKERATANPLMSSLKLAVVALGARQPRRCDYGDQ